jgi:LysR family glycine cleavage system transcriptional activator
MTRNLPPLNALKAFEAAGRHLSFTKAAEELHVTPAAISHQVKALEEFLGVPLFRRLARGLLLTDAGQRFLPGIGTGFDGLASAVDDLRGFEENGVLTVSVMHSLASRCSSSPDDPFVMAIFGLGARHLGPLPPCYRGL